MPIFIATSLYQRPASPANIGTPVVGGRSRLPWARVWYIWSGEFAPHKSLARLEDLLHDGNQAPKRK
jgi:hypothetical protein